MLLITSGAFAMGSTAQEASPQEQPVALVTIGCFYMARFPVTNAQYESFDASHRNKRTAWADDQHPVIHVTSAEAESFCQWLSQKEGRKYRLPTEAEWEYAARGTDDRSYPWGDDLDAGMYANFADVNTTFPWRDATINDGFAETARHLTPEPVVVRDEIDPRAAIAALLELDLVGVVASESAETAHESLCCRHQHSRPVG